MKLFRPTIGESDVPTFPRNPIVAGGTSNYLVQTTVASSSTFEGIVTRVRIIQISGLYIIPIQNGGQLQLNSSLTLIV